MKVIEVTKEEVDLFVYEVEKLVCGENEIEGISFCQVNDERLKISGLNVDTVVEIFSNLGMSQTEEILKRNYNSQLKVRDLVSRFIQKIF